MKHATPLLSPSQAGFAARNEATLGWTMTSGEALFYRKAKTLEDRWLVDRQGAVLDHVQMSMGASKQRDGAVAAAIAAAEGSPEVEIQRIPLVPEGLPSIDFVAHA